MSERRRQPDYDFFTPPRGAAPSGPFGTAAPNGQFGTAAPNGQFGTAAPSGQFGTAAPNGQFGTAATPSAAAAPQSLPTAPVPRYGGPFAAADVPGTFSPPPAVPTGPWSSPRTNRHRTAALLAISAAAAAAVTACALWGVPAYREHRADARWQRTQVSLPPVFDGASATSSPQLDKLGAGDIAEVDGSFPKAQIRLYRTSHGMIVAVAAKAPERLDDEDVARIRRAFDDAVRKEGLQPTDAQAGEGADLLTCVVVKPRGATCLSMNDSAMVMVVAEGSTDAAPATRQLWQESVHD